MNSGSDDGTRQAIQAAYDSQSDALAHKDWPGALAHAAPDFVGVGVGGDRLTFLERLRRMPHLSLITSLRMRADIQKIAVRGAEAMVQVRTRSVVTVMDPQTRRPVSEVAVYTLMDQWTRTAQGWRLEHSRELAVSRFH